MINSRKVYFFINFSIIINLIIILYYLNFDLRNKIDNTLSAEPFSMAISKISYGQEKFIGLILYETNYSRSAI